MTTITITSADNVEHTITATNGLSMMEVIRPLNIGVEGECEGSIACATCHLWIDPQWFSLLAAPSDDEADMLDCAFYVRRTSRLCCQIVIAPELDGLRATVPSKTGP